MSLQKLAFSLLAAAPLFAADSAEYFEKNIRPILVAKCQACHGAKVQMAGITLSTAEGFAKAKPKLLDAISYAGKIKMPPGGKLSDDQIENFRTWFADGAVWPATLASSASSTQQQQTHWAFQPVKKDLRPPVTSKPSWVQTPVDAFILAKLEEKKLAPAEPASRLTLLRRVTYDLTGLPPTLDEIRDFENDHSKGAFGKVVDRLLASPHYGERWGRHWLDVARYADSNGYEHDFDRPNAWRYRDYVIASFNADKPWNTFLREQLAGDELPAVTQETLIATGFLRNYAKVGFREKDNPEFRYEYLDDMIATVGRGVLGLTVQCARCHNHKFDPILQKDYYRLQASLFGYVEVDHPLTSREEADVYERKVADIAARTAGLRGKIRAIEQPYRQTLLEAKYRKMPANIQAAIFTPEAKRTPGQVLLANQITRTTSANPADLDRVMKPQELARKRELTAQIGEIEKERPKPIPVAMGITDGDYRFTPDGPGDEPAPGKGPGLNVGLKGSFLHQGPDRYAAPPSHFLIRGDVNSKGSPMQPGFLTVATTGNPSVELPPTEGRTSGRRLALAEWLVSAGNPLTARVLVNRIWHHHFGRGVVASIDNFGKMGDLPTHPELLDWLATEVVDRGWSVKQMHRLLMTSDAYQMSSQFTSEANVRSDPQNLYGWRFRARRLEGEIIRDAILATSGALNMKQGGVPVFPALPREVLAQEMHGIWRNQPDGPETWRRSVYVYRKRGLPFPLLETFDLPDQNISCGARVVSTVPTQALMLMNDEFVVKQAELFAKRIAESAPGGDPGQQIDAAYRIALGRAPDARERDLAHSFLKNGNLTGFAHVLLNLNEFVYLR